MLRIEVVSIGTEKAGHNNQPQTMLSDQRKNSDS
jgi:hypothetical protein